MGLIEGEAVVDETTGELLVVYLHFLIERVALRQDEAASRFARFSGGGCHGQGHRLALFP